MMTMKVRFSLSISAIVNSSVSVTQTTTKRTT